MSRRVGLPMQPCHLPPFSDITLSLSCSRVTFMCQFVCDGPVSQGVYVGEDNLEDSVLSFPHVGSSGLVAWVFTQGAILLAWPPFFF